MADFSVPITVPDAKVAELADALRWKWYSVNMTPEEYARVTAAELRAKLKEQIEGQLRAAFIEHKRWLAAQAAQAGADIEIT